MSDYEKVINYVSRGDDRGTAHIVVAERETEVDTACGRTLRKAGRFGIGRGGAGYVNEFGTVPRDDECGNCPWDEVNGGDDQ